MNTLQMIKGKLLYFCLFLLSSNCLTAEGMPQFNAKSFNSQLFWLIITFTALYLIITYFILPRIRENIRLRKNKIANDLERAEKIKAEIEKMISESNINGPIPIMNIKVMPKGMIANSGRKLKNDNADFPNTKLTTCLRFMGNANNGLTLITGSF